MFMNLKKSSSKIVSVVLALTMLCAASISVSAAEINQSGDSGSTPVNLTTTNGGLNDDGSGGGTVPPTKLNVTVPTALPMAVGTDGTVTTADNCKITNNSFGAVRVKTATINGENGWTLTAFGAKETLASEKVDSDQLGFAMTIGNGSQVATDKSNVNTQTLISAPVEGCYMTGVGDTANNSVAVNYDAIVTPLSVAATEATIASVVFVVEWDTAA